MYICTGYLELIIFITKDVLYILEFLCVKEKAAAFCMLSMVVRAKWTVTIWISCSSWKCLLCVSCNENAMSWFYVVSAQTLTLYRATRLWSSKKVIDHQKITCALFFELNEFLSMNSHLTDLKLLLEWVHMLIRVHRVTGECKNNSLLFPWFDFLSPVLRLLGFGTGRVLSLGLQTRQQTI